MAKNITSVPAANTIATGDKLVIVQGSSLKQLTMAKLTEQTNIAAKSAVEADNGTLLTDGAFIMYHRKSDNYPIVATYQAWPALQSAGEVADGVLVIQGDKHLVIAPTGASGMTWSSVNGIVDSSVGGDRLKAMTDWTGKTRTAAIVASATFGSDSEQYAPKYCATYSRVNANGKGLTAGKWWLPSGGEAFFIFANKRKINKCLSVINGAQLLPEAGIWTSTEGSSPGCWCLYLSYGYFTSDYRVAYKYYVRPVSAFIL